MRKYSHLFWVNFPLVVGLLLLVVGWHHLDRAGNEKLIADVHLVEIRGTIVLATGILCICMTCVCQVFYGIAKQIENR